MPTEIGHPLPGAWTQKARTCCSSIGSLCVVIVLLALVAVGYFVLRVDEEVRQRIEAIIQQRYPHLEISIGSAEVVEGKGIEIHGLRVRDPSQAGDAAEIVYVDEIFAHCDTSPSHLVQGQVEVTRLDVLRPRLVVERTSTGEWNVSTLLPLPRFSDHPPPAHVTGCTIKLRDASRESAREISLRDLEIKIAPVEKPAAQGDSPLMRLQGSGNCDYVKEFTFDSSLACDGTRLSAVCKVLDLSLSSEIADLLPWELAQPASALRHVSGRVTATFELTRDTSIGQEGDFKVSGSLQEGRIDDPRLPFPFVDFKAAFRADNLGLRVTDLSARNGPLVVRGSLKKHGFAEDSPAQVRLSARQLTIDQRLARGVSPQWQELYDRFRPQGDVDVDLTLNFDGESWQPLVTAHCRNVSFYYQKFPFRLERGSGRIQLTGDQLSVSLLALSQQSEVRIIGEFASIQPRPVGWIEFTCPDLAIDDKLLAALPEKQKEIVNSLHPVGGMSILARYVRDSSDQERMSKYMLLKLHGIAMRFDRFALPIEGITGEIEVQDADWTFRDLRGIAGTGQIRCAGDIHPIENGSQLDLRLSADRLPLDDQLRMALSPQAGQLWQHLRPEGQIDVHQARVTYDTIDRKINLVLDASAVEQTVSIEPKRFPYRIEKLRGDIHYDNGFVSLKNVRGIHGRTTWLVPEGTCELLPQGGWRLQLARLNIDRLLSDRQLIEAVPARLRSVINRLHPTGRVNLRGTIELAQLEPGEELLESYWDCDLDLHDSDLHCGLEIEHVHGAIHLRGEHRSHGLECEGELRFDSAVVRNVQLTDLVGPIWFNDHEVLLGTLADQRLNAQKKRHLVAALQGGKLRIDGRVEVGANLQYEISADVARVDVRRFTKEVFGVKDDFSGDLYARMTVLGNGSGLHNLEGDGAFELRNADIYRLPVMVQMLKLLSIKTPNATAFTECTGEFHLRGEHVYLDPIKFTGDAISLKGQGEVGLDKSVRLDMHALVGRDEIRVPVLSDLVGKASEQLLLIRVDGTLDHPQIRRETLPAVNQALADLQDELRVQSNSAQARAPKDSTYR